MFYWIPYAFVRIVVFFIVGILVGIYKPASIPIPYAVTILGLLVLIYLLICVANHVKKKEVLNPGIIGWASIFFAGYINVYTATETNQPGHLTGWEESVECYSVVLQKQPQEKERSWRGEARVRSVRIGGQWHTRHGKVLLHFSKQGFTTSPSYGDVLLIKGSPQPLQEPSNPGEFNHKIFLRYQNIYHQHFLKPADVVFLENDPPGTLMPYAVKTRLWGEQILKHFVAGERQQELAIALVLGITDGLDNELLQAYAATGTMHILAVSGVHVGIIYGILLFLLKPFNRTRTGSLIIAGLSIVVLWAYAFVTGLSPSVLRAVTMFSFIALARLTQQQTNIYNTMAASAFCLLLFNPFLIMSVGFQLSYLAVLGIVYVTPLLYACLEPEGKCWNEVWKVICVSLAAQLATFPLSLLYFHQFPNYFLLSNLLVIPLSFCALMVGLAVMTFSFFPWLATALGILLETVIRLLNFFVFKLAAFPFSTINGIHITAFQCAVLLAAIAMMILAAQYRKVSYGVAALIFFVMLTVSRWTYFYNHVNQNSITIYNVAGHSAMDLISTGHTCFFADTTLQKDRRKLGFHIAPNRLMHAVNNVTEGESYPLTRRMEGVTLTVWKGRTILRIEEVQYTLPEKIEVDYLIIANNAVKDLPALISRVAANEIILDSSNAYSFADNLIKHPLLQQHRVYSVLHQGAYNRII